MPHCGSELQYNPKPSRTGDQTQATSPFRVLTLIGPSVSSPNQTRGSRKCASNLGFQVSSAALSPKPACPQLPAPARACLQRQSPAPRQRPAQPPIAPEPAMPSPADSSHFVGQPLPLEFKLLAITSPCSRPDRSAQPRSLAQVRIALALLLRLAEAGSAPHIQQIATGDLSKRVRPMVGVLFPLNADRRSILRLSIRLPGCWDLHRRG